MMRGNGRYVLGAALLLLACGGSTSSGGAGGQGGSANASGSGGSGNVSSGGSGNASSGGSGNTSSGGTGAAAGYAQCSEPGTCTLLPANCCGYCGLAELSQFVAVELGHVQEASAELCPDPIDCPDCITIEEPNYLALCRGGACTAVDLRKDVLSACASDGDCQLRWGVGCCESCGGGGLVAVSNKVSFEAEACSTEPAPCPPCMPPPYPTTASAVCEAGHCSLKYSGMGGP